MSQSKNMRRICSLVLAAILLISMLPVSAMAAEESIVVIAASDYQLSNSGTIMTNIMNQIKEDYGTPYAALLGGDYDAGSISTKASHIEAVDDVIDSVFPDTGTRIYIQGNHENYAGLKVDGTNLMNYTGAYDTDYYGVYAFNHDDFPWSTSSNPSSSASLVQATADALGDYLEAKVAEGYEKPVFVMSHLPLHAARGDNYYARYIFDELEAAGEAGLNIIFLCGHNHSGGYDAYLGNGSFYLPVGSSLTVVDGKSGTYTDDSISFTYMNYGYLGKISGSACTDQTMTVFEITDSQVNVKRYAADGVHLLKAAGVSSGSYAANTTEIGTEGAVIELGEPVPSVTVSDNNVTVTSTGLTGLTATKVFGTDSTERYDAEVYAAYASYDITPEGYTDGKSATVTITLDESDGFDASNAVILLDQEKGTEKRLSIVDGTVTFTTNHFSTYDIAQKSPSAYYTYELVTSIEAGEKYVIVGNDDAVALMDASGSLGSQDVTISGTTLTSESELTEWTFSSATSGTITSSDGNNLGYSSSSWNLTGSGDCTFDIGTGSGNFSLRVIRASSGYNRYYFYYDGSDWAKNSGSTASYVRLYKLAEGGSTVEPEQPETPDVPETPDTEADWVALPAGNIYTLDTDGIDNGEKYLIVASSYAKALTAAAGSNNAADVTIADDTATADAAYGWIFSGSGSSWQISKDGTYLSRSSSSLAASSSAESWTVSANDDGSYTITQSGSSNSWWGSSNYYLRWSNSNGYFQASSYSTDPVRLYKYTGSGTDIDANYIRLGGEIQQTYTTADAATLDTILGKVMVETSADGVNTGSTTLTVTSDMVVWDNTFDGTTAGTYTGTVTCEGYNLGTITVTITAAEHNFETITVEATCTEDGSVTTKCTVCGEETVEVIPATGHDYDYVETAATCGENGSKVYTCTKCEDAYTESTPATGNHTNESITVDATCTKDGSVTTTCTVCGEETVEVIAAAGHNYEYAVTDATCGVDGQKVYTCTVCDDFYTETIPATENHTYESVTVDATCTEAGSVTHTCTVCGHTNVESLAALGHSYNSVTTAPTCTEEGFTTYTCATCGHSYTDGATAALGHDYDSVLTATCEEDGFVVYTCKTCGHSYNGEAVAAYGHSYETTTVDPTCATAGYTTYICTTCGHTYTGDKIAALGHDYVSVTVDATCTENGYITYTCSVCGHSYVGDEVLALGHDYESVVTEPTFETEGYTTHTCLVCGDVKVDSYVPVLSHDYESVTVEATCTEDGYTTYTCVTCGYTYTDVLTALGHSFTTVTTDATCTVNGSVVSTCAACGHEEVEVIPATGHSFETTVIDPTCTENGYTTSACACGHVVTEEIAALGHRYESKYEAPTCTETGGTTYTCSVCGHTYTDAEAALGHSYITESVAPTCTEAGYTTYTCSTCGDSYVADETAALGHDYAASVTAPTCTEEGFTTYTCTICGESYTADKTAASGHDYDFVVTDPTCTEGGYTVYTCTVCGHNYTGNETATLGHSYTCVETDGYLVYTCHCGDTYSEEIQSVTYNKVSSLDSDNRYVITLYSGSKYYALSHEDNKISVAEITVSGEEITSEITDNLIWDYADSKLSYTDGNTAYYLYAQPASGWWSWWFAPTLTLSTSNSTAVSFSNDQLKMGYYYLNYANGSVSLNWSATTTYCFLEK